MSGFLIFASILVMKDYFDVETDKVNAPHITFSSNLVIPNDVLYFFTASVIHRNTIWLLKK